MNNSKDLDKIWLKVEKLGVKPMLWAGTLLGAVREKGFIEGDSDIDIAYISEHKDPNMVHKECVELYKSLGDCVIDYFDEDWQKQKDKGYKSVFGHAHIGWKDTHFDLFTLWKDDEYLYDPWFGPVFDVKQEVVPDSLEFEGRLYSGLSEPEKILGVLYGDWQTPRKEKGTKRNKFRPALKQARGVV
jgi:hypothetical protein